MTSDRGRFVVVGLVAIAAGCSGRDPHLEGRDPTVPVRGVVTMDGQPLADAVVLFHCKEPLRTANARTDADGAFTLTTFDAGDGAVVGTHRVTVKKVERTTTPDPRGNPYPPKVEETWHTPEEYADEKTSPLEITIGEDGDTDVKLVVEAK